MISEELLRELDIEEGERFAYFEQFAALMETSAELDYDTFAELIVMADPEALPEMIASFFEDMIRGVPDDNTALYSKLETRREVLQTLAGRMMNRENTGAFIEELFCFREWFQQPESVLCTPEGENGFRQRLNPCQAMILYREEKLSGPKYDYDFSEAFLPDIDEYALSFMEDLNGESIWSDFEEDDELEELPDELPADFDVSSYVPGKTDLSEWTDRIDPYRDGLIDRDDPVIDGEKNEENC